MSQSETPEPGTERILRSTTRNPRRRPRQSDNDGTLSIQPPKRRRRNEVKDDTFRPRDSTENIAPPDTDSAAEEAEGNNIIVAMNGHPHHHHHVHDRTVRNGYGSHRETPMSIRSKPKRFRGDGATTLAQNACYSVKILPSTPKELRREGVEYRGSLSGAGHALAVTREKAIIWEYNAHVTASVPRTFDMPFPAKAKDPLPFGALISNGAAGADVGLVLISATTGKAVFYDSIDRATSLGLFQDKNTAVEGLVGSLFSGETVVDLVSADYAGFVVILSSGRIAHLTLRDAQGKPKVSGQFMRVTDNSGGLLSSFGRLWSGGFRKGLTAVHTRPTSVRGQMQAIGMTEKAEVLIWDLEWSGRSEFRSSVEFWDMFVGELNDLQIPEMAGKVHQTTVLDFAILDKPSSSTGNEIAIVGMEQPLVLAVLLRVGNHDMHNYALAEVLVRGDHTGITRITSLSTYRNNGDTSHHSKPRLVIPKPGHTAFVAFEDATLMVSTEEPESPEAQFHQQDQSIMESVPELFEETIHLKSDKHLTIQNIWEEVPRGSSAYVVAFVKSAGLVRISAVDVHTLPNALGNGAKISPKSKIEQAVFYGALQPDNIIDFSRRTDSKFKDNDIEQAALEVSHEIFRAETAFTNVISPSPTSMEQHLAMKAKALKALAACVRQDYPVLSRSAMWKLLWDAERVAAGRQLWIAFEEHVAMSMQNGKRKATVLDELCEWFVDEKDSYTLRDDLKDEGAVRKFFIGGLHRLEKLLQHTHTLLKDLRAEPGKSHDERRSPEIIMRSVYQANDIWTGSLETAFTFRSDNCSDYGILPELIDDGILIDPAEYVDVPEFWTSTEALTSWTVSVAAYSRHFATEYYDPETMPVTADTTREIAMSSPRLVNLYCLQAREGILWRASRHSPKEQERAKELRQDLSENRYQLCRQLAAVGQSEAGMKLAERYEDMHTLTDMVIAEEQYFVEELQRTDLDQENLGIAMKSREELEERVRRYFDKYGNKWADEFFDKLFSGASIGDRLEQAQVRWQTALATYLRSHPSRAKICWINDVTTENDFAHASEVLLHSAEKQESRLWAKKVELSISKLAQLAANEASGLRLTTNATSKDITPAKDLILVDVQEKLERHFRRDTADTIDHEAAVEVVIKKYGQHLADYPHLRKTFEHALSLLLDHRTLEVEQLIDILTLMDVTVISEDLDNLQHAETLNALIALDAVAPTMPPNRFETHLQLIWKRCYIYDDWAEVQLSKKKSDTERKQGLRGTAMWHSFYQIISSGFLSSSADRHVRFLLPSECLGSGCLPEDLAYRFPDEDLLDPILRDCKIQDDVLQGFVVDRRLDEIVAECMRDVKSDLENGGVDESASIHAGNSMILEGEDDVFVDGDSLDMNGHVNGSSFSKVRDADGDGDGDGEGDEEMEEDEDEHED